MFYDKLSIFKLFKAPPTVVSWMLIFLEKGFTFSEELKKRMLSEIKFADLTIGDLAKLGAGATAPEAKEQPAAIKPLRRF